MLFATINKKKILEILIKCNHVIGKKSFKELFELIEQKSGINLNYDDETVKILKNRLYSIKRNWFLVRKHTNNRRNFLLECFNSECIFEVIPKIITIVRIQMSKKNSLKL